MEDMELYMQIKDYRYLFQIPKCLAEDGLLLRVQNMPNEVDTTHSYEA